MQKLRKDIRESGYKIKYLAAQIEVSSTMLSLFLSGERNLKEWQIDRLKELVCNKPVFK